ncbi:MAG: hypothetical protein AAF766_16385 [Cyanobacteria bacterium P01_D01_bin.14]
MKMLKASDAETIAKEFLLDDLEILAADREFFCVIAARDTGSDWYIIEIGIEGLPDRWILQVFDTGQCDPCYTFSSPVSSGENDDLEEFPHKIAAVVAAERAGGII